MTGKSKTKLLKMVCKQADLLRAPYRGSSWSIKISQKVTKSLFLNQNQAKLQSIKSSTTTKCRENMVRNSEGMDHCQTCSNNVYTDERM